MKLKAVYLALALVLLFSLAAVISPIGRVSAQTTWYVDDDNCPGPGTGTLVDPFCSIQNAIGNASADDTIIIAVGTYNEHDITINKSLTIQGAGAGSTFVDGQDISRVFYINQSIVDMSGMTIRNGNTIFGGGGIYNNMGNVTLTNCTISGNYANDGGGIFNVGDTLTMIGCTISGNSALGEDSGGIYNSGTLTMTNCTISGNYSSEDGGGIDNRSGGDVTLTNCTISANNAEEDGGGIRNDEGTLTLTCTIVYGNTAGSSGDDIHNSDTLILDYYSIIGGSVDPLLGPLRDNGGPTETHALMTGSPAIDACTTDCPLPATDQRGRHRPADGDLDGTYFCDVGAYEKQISVGGIVEPVDRLELLAPWLALAALMAVSLSVVVIMKRRRVA